MALFDISNAKVRSVILMIISLYCKTVWLNRNVKQFENKMLIKIYYILIFYLN